MLDLRFEWDRAKSDWAEIPADRERVEEQSP
jgi:hypothetical protein